MNRKKIFITLVALFLLETVGCNSPPPPSTAKPHPPSSRVADPAVRKCVDDGFSARPVMENGVPKGYVCLNPATGKKCDAWAYYRKTCHLE